MSTRYPVGGVIPLPYHYLLLRDQRRCDAFRQAIEREVQPGAVVLDLGAGTGLLSYFAAQKARRVYAVESDPTIASLCGRLVDENGLSDRVEVVTESAFDYCPSEPVDVVICEMLHVGLATEPQVAVLNSTRARLQTLYPDHPYRVIPGLSVSYVQVLQANYDVYGYQARFLRYADTYLGDPDSKPLSTIQAYWTADFAAMVNPTVSASVELPVSDGGTLNTVRVMTQVATAFDRDQPSPESLVDWYLMSLYIPIAAPFDVRGGQTVQVGLAYEAGCPVEDIGVTCALRG